MFRLNIFRNHNIDAQVGYLMDAYDQGLRKQTETYWRDTIAAEIKTKIVDSMCENFDDACDVCTGLDMAYWIVDEIS